MSRESGWTNGEPLHGELAEGTDASGGIEIPLYGQNGRRHFIAPQEQIELVQVGLVSTAGGDCRVFWDFAVEADIATATAGSTDQFTVAGDLTGVLGVGETFYVYGSTGNDGEYTVLAISYDLGTDTTTISVLAVADGTDDGTLAWVYWAIDDADSSANTFTVAGDLRKWFRADRLFKVDGSTGNDNSGNDYTVTSVSYNAATDTTTISVSSVADGTNDGYIILQPTEFAGRKFIAGDYAANGGREGAFSERIPLRPGNTLYGVAAAGNVDFDATGFLKKNLRLQ